MKNNIKKKLTSCQPLVSVVGGFVLAIMVMAGVIIIFKTLWPNKVTAPWIGNFSLVVLGLTVIGWGISWGVKLIKKGL